MVCFVMSSTVRMSLTGCVVGLTAAAAAAVAVNVESALASRHTTLNQPHHNHYLQQQDQLTRLSSPSNYNKSSQCKQFNVVTSSKPLMDTCWKHNCQTKITSVDISVNVNLKLVDKFRYLGDMLSVDGDADAAVETRI